MFQLLLLLGFCSLDMCLCRQYHFVNESKTWAEAQSYCREHYFDLASVDNAEEALELVKLADIRNSNSTWIGLYDDLNSWRWSLDDDSFYKENERSFRNWYKENPKNWGGDSLCTHFQFYDGRWSETYCLSSLRFVCYDGRGNASESYVLVNQYMTWTEAQRYCREHHTDLASVRNEAENQKLRSLYYYDYSDVWIGLYRTRSWSDNSSSSFSFWKTGQPDNAGQSEHCTAVSFSDSGKWTDNNCGQAFPFICYNMTESAFSRQYHFVYESKSWTEAQRFCRENYTDLATIENMEEMNSLISTWNDTVNGSYVGLAWIGLYDDLNSWRWSYDNESFYKEGERDFRGWYHEPNNWNGKEMCVSIGADGMWFDQNCQSYLPFVCYDGRNGNNDYIWINQHMFWEEAQRYCREYYTDLASVRNWTDNQIIFSVTGGSSAWIGLYRSRLWSDQHELTYKNWRPGIMYSPQQPDNGFYVNGEYGNQHCTAVSFSYSGQWTDENCLAKLPFVCYTRFWSWSPYVSHQYHFVGENKSWTEAQRYCRENYTDLATIENMEEMSSLMNTANGRYFGLAWIGLYDDLKSWRWSLDNELLYKQKERSFRNWYTYKPMNWGGNSLCTYFSSYDGAWHEYPCSYGLPFFCYDENVNEQYIIILQLMNWTEAQRYCREHHTDLASVRNEAENQKLRTFNYYFHYYYGSAWIGLYRTRAWSDSSSSSFSYWKTGQPDNIGVSENCTAVSFYDSGKWTNENCGEAFPFLCYSNSSQYHFINNSKTWTEAQRFCRENYTDLATIENMEEMNSLMNTVNGSYVGLAWIGLYDDLNSWRWSYDNESFYKDGEKDFRGWFQQPDNHNGNELCVSMSPAGEWFDIPCSDRERFVCYNGTNGTNFVWISELKTWSEAQSFCRMFHTDLASVRNETELQDILRISNGSTVWIGLYRKRLWSDQSSSTFTYWRPQIIPESAEPDNGIRSPGQLGNEHCTAVDHSGYWKDENCLSSFPFICYSAAVIGLRVNVKTARNLYESEIRELVVIQLQNEFSRLGLPGNFSINVKNIRKTSP
ncbi:C-type mannose receptor 2-like [Astyanax mexicanus]|uniref:C-type mannose receptor 2-like n=1 Tax=Astyanax mexicanus TaxID=7994 RepID=UPI0020CAC891|nr:C-type mannose receptor 2-like [Astyanax mexicanus]